MSDYKVEFRFGEIYVTLESDYGRCRERWRIRYDAFTHSLRLIHYNKCERPTKRHKWGEVVAVWDSLDNTKVSQPKLSNDLKIAAKTTFLNVLRFEP